MWFCQYLVLVCILSLLDLKYIESFKLIRCLMMNSLKSASNLEISFGGVKYLHPISTALLKLGVEAPSPIQKVALTPLTLGMSCILHSETGSGKTLAYLLPLLKRLISEGELPMKQSPKAIIIVPTRELAIQV